MPRPIAHVPHFEADCFPDCLKTEYTQFDSLCLEGKLFARGEFDAFLRSGRLLPALQAVTHLTLNDIPNVPRIVLASCVQLQKLEMRGVRIVDDGSRRILAPRPALRELVCPGMDEHSFMLLVSVVDVTRLTMLCCALPEAGTTASSIWPQPLLDLCRGSLSVLMLSSLRTSSSIYHIRAIDYSLLTLCTDSAPHPAQGRPRERLFQGICDLSRHTALTRLTFVAPFLLECDHHHSAGLQTRMFTQVLATLLKESPALRGIEYQIHMGLEGVLRRTPAGRPRLDTTAPLQFFQHHGWYAVDNTLARVARGRPMNVFINVLGHIAHETHAAYDPQELIYDSMNLNFLMEEWGRKSFAQLATQQQANLSVAMRINPPGSATENRDYFNIL